MTLNPLCVPVSEPIDYQAIQAAHIEPAIRRMLDENRRGIDAIAHAAAPARYDTVVEPLDELSAPLWRAWSVAGHLNAVVNTPQWREAYNQCLPLVTEFSTWVGLHQGLYRQYKQIHESPEFSSLSPTRQRIVTLALRDFRLGGVELEGDDRTRYADISDKQAQASQKFSENVLDAIDNWSLLETTDERLAGLPDSVKRQARADAEADGKAGWKLTLKMPCYLPVMQYAADASLRREMYRAYTTVASELGDPAYDNSRLIEELLHLRANEAALLGYASFAQLRLETRMADNAEQVVSFLRDLAARAKPFALRDLNALRRFAAEDLGMNDLQPWDIAYVSERLREARFNYSEDQVKQYFTEPQVLKGLFQVVRELFGVTLAPANLPTWHPHVQAWHVLSSGSQIMGTLYLDLYARQGKQSGAWVDSERTRHLRTRDNTLITPVVYLTCNFPPPQDGKPACLTHDDVITLFHESGHALHALLSEVNDPGASAFASVEWDAIELPSQFMENFCWEWPVVQQLSCHVDTGESLPRALYDKLLAARNFQSGMQMVRQIEFSLFDMLIHHQAQGMSVTQVLDTLNEVRAEVAVLFPPEWHRFPHNFSHLFAGGYGAGYYSYKWAEVLSADAYAFFEENALAVPGRDRNVLNAQSGQRFLKEILAVGGARPAAESFQAFRGRPPSVDALLRHSGLIETA